MKRFISILAAALCALSLTACAERGPSAEEVEKAIEEGSVTIEDALDKGWITQEWADQYMESRTVDAADKTEAFAIGDFQTQTISQEAFSRQDLKAVTFWAFIDPEDPEAENWYAALVNVSEQIQEKGAGILVCSKSDKDTDLFQDAPFPVVLYNDSVKEALSSMNMAEMVEELPNTGVWYVGTYFASSWYSKLDEKGLVEDTDAFLQMYGESEDVDTEDGAENAASAIMG